MIYFLLRIFVTHFSKYKTMTYDKGAQFTVERLKKYLDLIPDDVKICVGIGDDITPAHYLINRDGKLVICVDCYMQNADENNLITVLSFNSKK